MKTQNTRFSFVTACIFCFCLLVPSLSWAWVFIQGTVTNADEQPIAGATLETDFGSSRSDENGEYATAHPSGSFDITVSAVGYLVRKERLVIEDDGTIFDQNFILQSLPLRIDYASPRWGEINQDLTISLYGAGFSKETRVLGILDTGDRQIITGSVWTPGQARDIIVVNNIAYVADGDFGLHIVDVSNPSVPNLTGSVALSGVAYGVSVVGDIAYVAGGDSGLQIVDVSNPEFPVLAGSVVTPGIAYGVSVVGNIAYVADGDSGLQIVDVTIPASPVLVGTVVTPDIAYGVSVVADIAYVADGNSGLQIVDVNTSASPVLVGSVATSGTAYGLTVVDSIAYVADYNFGLQVIDVSNPSAPFLTGFVNTPGYARDVTVADGIAYVAAYSSGLQVVDVGNPSAPVLISSAALPGSANGVSVVGGTAYVADTTIGLTIVPVPVELIRNNPAGDTTTGITATLPAADIAGHYNIRVFDTVTMDEKQGAVTVGVVTINPVTPVSETPPTATPVVQTIEAKAIIVAGWGPDGENKYWNETVLNAEYAYGALLVQGYSPENIRYLSSEPAYWLDGTEDVVWMDASNDNLRYALLSPWAQTAKDMVIYLVDHGGIETFKMKPDEDLDAADLAEWFNSLQDIMTGRLLLIYEACNSGSFLAPLQIPQDKDYNRIIMTSSASNEASTFWNEGRLSFSYQFWATIYENADIVDALFNGTAMMSSLKQNVWYDANGNGVSGEFEDRIADDNKLLGRGWVAPSYIQGTTQYQLNLPLITQYQQDQTLVATSIATLWVAEPVALHPISKVWALLVPPDYDSSIQNVTEQMLISVDLHWSVDNNRYEVDFDGFTLNGEYRISYYVMDDEQLTSLPATALVTQPQGFLQSDFNHDGNVDLADEILILQLLTGITSGDFIDLQYDINGDNHIGLAEAIYTFNFIAGSIAEVDDDGDGHTESQWDCDDGDATIYLGAQEICGDGIDQDCNGSDCENVDDDNDGFYSPRDGDCNDDNEFVYPGAPEICDGIDNDCDVTTADGSSESWFDELTSCGDGICVAAGSWICFNGVMTNTCSSGDPADDANCNGLDDDCDGEIDEDYPGSCEDDNDGDGITAEDGDCNDSDRDIRPGAPEICDGIDNDCDPATADGSFESWFDDATSCGVGECSTTGSLVCSAGVQADTCNPGTPAADDASCNGLDDDCDGTADEDYLVVITSCGVGYCLNTGESACNNGIEIDSCVETSPIDEICGDDIDQDCNGSDLLCPEDSDDDSDGYSENEGDCDDTAAGVYPGAAEICDDGTDQDCDGSDLSCAVVDGDNDGFTPDDEDCDDGNSSVYPGADENCDSLDNDCNPATADGSSESWFGNVTSCGVGECGESGSLTCSAGIQVDTCSPGAPTVEICGDGIDQDCDGNDLLCPEDIDDDSDGYTENEGDCDDTDAGVYPGAVESCDGLDNDCDGLIDEDVINVLFYDGFEGYSIGTPVSPWVFHSPWGDHGTVKIVEDPTSQGLRAIKVTGDDGWAQGIIATDSLYEGDQIVSFDVRIPSGNEVGAPISYFLYAGLAITFNPTADDAFIEVFSGGQMVTTLSSDTWYTFTLEIDWDNATVTITAGQDTTAPLVFTKNSAGGWWSDISLYGNNTSNNSRTGYYDEIKIITIQEATTWYLDNDNDGYGNIELVGQECTQLFDYSNYFVYEGDVLPSADGWTLLNYPSYEAGHALLEGGRLHIIDDTGGSSGTAIHYMKEWIIDSNLTNVAEFDVQLVSSSIPMGIIIGTNTDFNMLYGLMADRILSFTTDKGSFRYGEEFVFDTTSQVNTYKTIIENGIARLYINNSLALEQLAGVGTYGGKAPGVEFGAASSEAICEAYFDEIRVFKTGAQNTLTTFEETQMPQGWTTDNDGWYVSNDDSYVGDYSLRALHNSGGTVSFTEVTGDGDFSFYVKPGYLTLSFYIDGELIQQWTLSDNWEQFSYTIPAGTHTFMWHGHHDTGATSFIDNVSWPKAGLSNGLIAYYAFEDNAYDSSGNGNNGVAQGGMTYTTGVNGQSAVFDGVDDFIQINSTALLRTEQYTVSFFAKTSQADVVGAIWSGEYHLSSNDGSGYGIYKNTALVHDKYRANQLTRSTGNFGAVAEDSVDTNWHHITATWDGLISRIYVDGVLSGIHDTAASAYYPGPIRWESPPADHMFFIGKAPDGTTNDYFDGAIDDLRIYNRALNAGEVAELAIIACDGDGDIGITTQACTQPVGYVANDTDCDDNEDSIYPSATEICEDGIDQDCDGSDLLCTCDSNHLDSCTTESSCASAGGYWWTDNSCHATETTECYQETATEANSCGATAGGSYSPNGAWNDGEWNDLYTTVDSTGHYVTYEKPVNATSATLIAKIYMWQNTYQTREGTIPQSCWDAGDNIQLWIHQEVSDPRCGPQGQYCLFIDCFDGSSWNNTVLYTGSYSSGSSFNTLYEEGITWISN